jgi:MoaA/NifB/PqqE/SkfB family radical SAM enzyme
MLPNSNLIAAIAAESLPLGPQSIYLDISTVCNMHCNFCWIHSPLQKKIRPHLYLPFPVIRKILDAAVKWQTREIILSGDGEPSLHPDIKAIITQAQKHKLRISMTTNAAFSQEQLPTMSRIDSLSINFAAASKKLYTAVHAPRQPAMFDKVTRNIKILGMLDPRKGAPELKIACVIHKINFRHLRPLLTFASRNRIRSVFFRLVETNAHTRSLQLSANDKKELLTKAQGLLRRKWPFHHNLSDICENLQGHALSPYHLKSCYSGWYNLFVDFNQNAGFCCHNEQLTIGSLKDHPVEALWKNRSAQLLRRACRHHFDIRKKPFKGKCELCPWHKDHQNIEHVLTKLGHAQRHP